MVKMVRVGINGMGEVGRYLLRAHQEQTDAILLRSLFEQGGLNGLVSGRQLSERALQGIKDTLDGQTQSDGLVEIVAINSRSPPDKWAHLLLNSSIYGRFPNYFGLPGSVGVDGDKNIVVNGRPIKTYVGDDAAKIPWNETGVDVVVDATGAYDDKPGIEGHLKSGINKVIITAPSNYAKVTLVPGVNDDAYNGQTIISSGSCTTNALAPLAKALLDRYGAFTGLMTTIHAYTGSQSPADATNEKPELGFAIDDNFIPTTTGAARAIGFVLPQLEGRLTGLAVRGPVSTGSLVDLTVDLGGKYTAEEVNAVLKAAADGYLKGTLGYTDKMMVSSMIKGSPIPSMVSGKNTISVGNLVKVFAFYDNIGGFSHQVLKLAQLVGQYASPTTPNR